MIDGSRRSRIAKGSGVTVTEVSGLVTRFFDAQKMMKRMAGGMGIPGMPGGRKGAKAAQKKAAKGRRVSGDPRKAALGKAAPAETGEPATPAGNGLLGKLGSRQQPPPGLELPPGFDPSKFKLPGQK